MGIQWVDSFVNLLAGMGVPGRDKFASQAYSYTPMTQFELEAAYRGDWIARKVIDIPAFDMTREWRQWQADEAQVELLEDLEKNLYVQQKVQQALIKSRLYGGALIIMGVDSGAPEEQLNPESVTKDSLKFLHVVSMINVVAGPIDTDVMSPYFGLPTWYSVRSGPQTGMIDEVQLHPSRVVRFIGMPVPDQTVSLQQWGDSVLQPLNDTVKACGLVAGSLATLISEMKIDIISIPDMTEIVSTPEGTAKMQTRFSTANAMKSVINTVVLDTTETWQRVTANLTGMPEVMAAYLQVAAGAADIPAGRFLGLPHRGLNVTGEADFRNYYDHLAGLQSTVLTPAMSVLDEVIIRSALGSRPPEIYYEWSSLWQLSDGDKADIALKKAQAYQIDVNAAQIPTTALANGRVNQLIEDGTYPGLQKALEDAAAEGDTIEEFNAPQPDPMMQPGIDPATGEPIDPGAPQPPTNGSALPKGNGRTDLPRSGSSTTLPGARRSGDSATLPFVEDINECHEPAGSSTGGQFCAEGSGAGGETSVVPQPVKGMATDEVRAGAHKVADDLGFDKSRIDVVSGTREFEVNGVKHTAAGDANIVSGEQGRIRLYQEHLRPDSLPGVAAHEIEHEKFQGAIDAYRRESDAIMTDRPAPNPESEHWWERRGEIMKADGSLFPPYDKKYPNYTAMHDALFAHGIDEFAKGDGVSDYSAEYWKGYHEHTVSPDIAMHETLAEMARIKYTTGNFPEHYGYSRLISERVKGTATTPEGYVEKQPRKAEGTTRWRNLYRTVDRVYKERQT